jgi:hypothetical protein
MKKTINRRRDNGGLYAVAIQISLLKRPVIFNS